jgi:hypothetical protein
MFGRHILTFDAACLLEATGIACCARATRGTAATVLKTANERLTNAPECPTDDQRHTLKRLQRKASQTAFLHEFLARNVGGHDVRHGPARAAIEVRPLRSWRQGWRPAQNVRGVTVQRSAF